MAIDFYSLGDFEYDQNDKTFLLKLLLIDGLGRKTAAEVIYYLKKHEVEKDHFWVGFHNFLAKMRIKKNIVELINNDKLEQEYCSIIRDLKSKDIRVISFWEKEYPILLRQTDDFPLLLFAKGNIELLNSKCIAVVGTRKVTSYGDMVTKKLVSELVDYDYTIVSGCMYGVDQIAHQTAIDNDGKTIAVLGYGFDQIKPLQAIKLQEEILIKNGCLITEYFPKVSANKGTFPERNRIVAGISSGVLVTEAAIQSGTHITADFALEAGREVFAVPGSILNPYAQGTKYLINQGAKLVSCATDLVAEFQKGDRIPNSTDFTDESLKLDVTSLEIVKELRFLSQSTDDLAKKTKLSVKELLNVLGMLELENIVENERGRWRSMI